MGISRIGRFGRYAVAAVVAVALVGNASAAVTDSPSLAAPTVTTQPTPVETDDDAHLPAGPSRELILDATEPTDDRAVAPGDMIQDIPLERVWAVRMPGTRPLEVAILDDGSNGPVDPHDLLLNEILANLKTFGLDVRGGFVVNGMDVEVLQAAHGWLVDERPPSRLSRQRPVALVFFSHQKGMDIHVRQVWQRGLHIEVQYDKVPRDDQEYSAQIAIIPLNTLPAGMLKVVLHGQLDPAAASDDTPTSDAPKNDTTGRGTWMRIKRGVP